MISKVFSNSKTAFSWIDVLNPTVDDFQQLTDKFGLHPASVKDCMSPSHLPKYEIIGDIIFIIARVYDENARKDADTVQQLTNKVAIFFTPQHVITIHRKDEPFLKRLREKWENNTVEDASRLHLLNELLYDSLQTFERGISLTQEILDRDEQRIFQNTKDRNLIKELYEIKRKASIFKRLLLLSKDIIRMYVKHDTEDNPFSHDLLETVDQLYFTADDLNENANNLLNLYLSLASHRMNEIMGVLTIFSVFFLPLTFIAGWYGMNFHNMPELDSSYGYYGIIGFSVISALTTYVWFRRKGWL